MAATLLDAVREAGIELADARALFRGILENADAHFAANLPLTGAQRTAFLERAARRRAGEPVAYITGTREFYSLEFKVTPAVLIPRPETELLVELALARLPADHPARILDLATGSGCVAVAIAKERPLAQVTATDVSREALAIAKENATAHRARVEFVESDWFAALPGRRFDLIVANPPYVADDDPHLAAGDLRFEPRTALVAGLKGLDCIEAIVEQAPRYLEPGGSLLLEHGHDQGARVRVLLTTAQMREVTTCRDLAGIERATGGRV